MRALIGDAACETDAQCATIGVGAKACGGPLAYAPWSRLRTDAAALRAAVDAQAAHQRQSGVAVGNASDCMVVSDPGAWCDRRASVGHAGLGACRLKGRVMPTRPQPAPPVR